VSNTITILFFGQLQDITGSNRAQVSMASNTDLLREQLIAQFPLLEETTYVMTVDRKIVRQNTPVDERSEIALLPPFSGG